MSASPAHVQAGSPPRVRQGPSISRVGVLLVAIAVVLLATLIGWALDDGNQVRSNGVTAATASPTRTEGLAGLDLGGSAHHRSGNQP